MPEKVLISFLINNESKFAKKLNKEEKLPAIRKFLSENYLKIQYLHYPMEAK